MPRHDPQSPDEPRDRHEALLRPDAAEAARVRALLAEIENQVFGSAGARSATTKDIERAVNGLFGDG